jgi:hypothetical protein
MVVRKFKFKITLTGMLVLYIFNIYGQKSHSISGFIYDDLKSKLGYSSICILNGQDSTIIIGAIADSNGFFNFSNINSGNYILCAGYIGYAKCFMPVILDNQNKFIDSIQLKRSAHDLLIKEVEIIAPRTIIEKKPEGFEFHVENSITASNGTALDALGKAPGVFINQQSGVSLKGKSDILILIDGTPLNLSVEEELNYLKTLNAQDISKIKIITNPSSKYDAEGSGVIDIITKKNKTRGINATLKYDYAKGNFSTHKPGFDFNYRNHFINIFGNFTYENGKTSKEELENIVYSQGKTTSSYDQHSYRVKLRNSIIFRTGVDLSINNNNIGFLVNGYGDQNNVRNLTNTAIIDSTNSLASIINTNDKIRNEANNLSYNLNYRWRIDTLGKEINFDADYCTYSSSANQFITNDFLDKNSVLLYSDDPSLGDAFQNVKIRTAKTNFIFPFNNGFKFEFGGKISLIGTDNSIYFNTISEGIPIPDTTLSNTFNYEENIKALFGSLSYTRELFNLQAGVRFENTQTNGNSLTLTRDVKSNYKKLFPSLFFEYLFNQNHQLDLSYSSRIARPDYWELNPFRWYINPYSFVEGNPYLKSAYINSLELSYTAMQLYSLTIYYEIIKEPFMQIPVQDNVNKTIRFIQVNLDQGINYGLSLNLPLTFFKCWESTNSFTIFEQQEESEFLNNDINSRQLAFDFQTTNTVSIPGIQKLYAEISSYYTSPRLQGLFEVGNSFDLSFGIRKVFMKNKATISLLFSDIFYTNSPTARIDYFDQNSSYKFKLDSRIFRVSLSFKLGNNTLKSPLNRETGNEDEMKRLKAKNR